MLNEFKWKKKQAVVLFRFMIIIHRSIFFAYTSIYDFIPKWLGCMGVVHV